mgnify:FL=1
MSFTARDLDPLVRGDDWTIKLVLKNGSNALDINGYTYKMTLKANIDDADPGALQLSATPSVADSPTEASQGILYITATDTQTDSLEAKTYNYDVQQKDDAGKIQTLLIGKVKVVKDVTRSTT